MTKLAEPAIKNLMTIVSGNMASNLTTIQNEYNDGIPLPVPAAANYYFGSREQIPEFPALTFEWIGSDIDPERFSNTWATYDHQVHIDIWLRSDSETTIAYQVHRYARAVWMILYGNQADTVAGGAAAISVRPKRLVVSPAIRHQGALHKVVRIVCEVHRFDDLS